MPWDRSAPTNPKYHTAEHRNLRARWVRAINAGEYVECTATECVMATRRITNPNGRARGGLHLGHEDDGVTYRGPQHNACNVKDGAKRARARQDAPQPRRWVL
jgi:hypothetical protein